MKKKLVAGLLLLAVVVGLCSCSFGVMDREAVNSAKVAPKEDFVVEEIDGRYFVTGYKGNAKIVVMPNGLANGEDMFLADEAFKGCAFKGFRLSDEVIGMGNRCFADCPNLEVYVGSETFSSIGDEVFKNCPKLRNVHFSVLGDMGDRVFEGDTALTQLFLPVVMSEIGEDAFLNSGVTTLISNSDFVEKYAKENEMDFVVYSEMNAEAKLLADGYGC